jgi:hypothetical protein
MEGLAMFDQKGLHNVLISEAFFKTVTSRQGLERLVTGYLKKNYKGYKLLKIDVNSGFAICERLDEEGELDEQQCDENRKNKLTR